MKRSEEVCLKEKYLSKAQHGLYSLVHTCCNLKKYYNHEIYDENASYENHHRIKFKKGISHANFAL